MNDAMDRALEMISDQQQTQEEFRVRGGFIIAALAVLLAIAALLGNNVEQDVLRYSVEAADAYAFFQAKNIRQTDYKLALDTLKLAQADSNSISPEQRALIDAQMKNYADTIARYESEPDPNDPNNPIKGEGKKELLARARYVEQQRLIASERDNNYDYASVLLQISIVVASASIIVVSRPLMLTALALAGLGILFIVNGFFLLVPLPF
ncbi:MAG: DUF4337 domain-containing protein [Chloroflexota bacterium]|nr:MAG: DUF4337 domain-containing protein [Chloroflexota bacterium]